MVSLLLARSLADWVRDTGSTRQLLAGERLGRGTTHYHYGASDDWPKCGLAEVAVLVSGELWRLRTCIQPWTFSGLPNESTEYPDSSQVYLQEGS